MCYCFCRKTPQQEWVELPVITTSCSGMQSYLDLQRPRLRMALSSLQLVSVFVMSVMYHRVTMEMFSFYESLCYCKFLEKKSGKTVSLSTKTTSRDASLSGSKSEQILKTVMFLFKLLAFTEEYPNKPPSVKFVSKMFHPNVYADGGRTLFPHDWLV